MQLEQTNSTEPSEVWHFWHWCNQVFQMVINQSDQIKNIYV